MSRNPRKIDLSSLHTFDQRNELLGAKFQLISNNLGDQPTTRPISYKRPSRSSCSKNKIVGKSFSSFRSLKKIGHFDESSDDDHESRDVGKFESIDDGSDSEHACHNNKVESPPVTIDTDSDGSSKISIITDRSVKIHPVNETTSSCVDIFKDTVARDWEIIEDNSNPSPAKSIDNKLNRRDLNVLKKRKVRASSLNGKATVVYDDVFCTELTPVKKTYKKQTINKTPHLDAVVTLKPYSEEVPNHFPKGGVSCNDNAPDSNKVSNDFLASSKNSTVPKSDSISKRNTTTPTLCTSVSKCTLLKSSQFNFPQFVSKCDVVEINDEKQASSFKEAIDLSSSCESLTDLREYKSLKTNKLSMQSGPSKNVSIKTSDVKGERKVVDPYSSCDSLDNTPQKSDTNISISEFTPVKSDLSTRGLSFTATPDVCRQKVGLCLPLTKTVKKRGLFKESDNELDKTDFDSPIKKKKYGVEFLADDSDSEDKLPEAVCLVLNETSPFKLIQFDIDNFPSPNKTNVTLTNFPEGVSPVKIQGLTPIKVHNQSESKLVYFSKNKKKLFKNGSMVGKALTVVKKLKLKTKVSSYEIEVGIRCEENFFKTSPLVVKDCWLENEAIHLHCQKLKCNPSSNYEIILKENEEALPDTIVLTVPHFTKTILFGTKIRAHYPIKLFYNFKCSTTTFGICNYVQILDDSKEFEIDKKTYITSDRNNSCEFSFTDNLINLFDSALHLSPEYVTLKNSEPQSLKFAVLSNPLISEFNIFLTVLHYFKSPANMNLIAVDQDGTYCLIAFSQIYPNSLKNNMTSNLVGKKVFLKNISLYKQVKVNNDIFLKTIIEFSHGKPVNSDIVYCIMPSSDSWDMSSDLEHSDETVTDFKFLKSNSSFTDILNNPNETFRCKVICKILQKEKVTVAQDVSSNLNIPLSFQETSLELNDNVIYVLDGLLCFNKSFVVDNYCDISSK